MAANAGYPNPSGRNSYVPSPQVVHYSIFGLFVLENQQVDLHHKTPSFPHWLTALSGHSCHGWLLGTLIASPIGTPIHRRGWATRRFSRKLLSSLMSLPSTTSTSTLRMSVSSLKSMIAHVTISQLHFGPLLPGLHPLFQCVCCSGGPGCFCHSPGASWPPGLTSLFHNSICNSSVTFLHSIYSGHHNPSPINWACQAESDILCISQGEPIIEWSSFKE